MPRPRKPENVLRDLVEHLTDAIAARLKGTFKAAAPAAKAAGGRRRKGQKRTAEEIAELTASLHAYIKAHPGKRIEEIARGMRKTTKDLVLSAKKLLTEKKAKTKGQKRATRYFP